MTRSRLVIFIGLTVAAVTLMGPSAKADWSFPFHLRRTQPLPQNAPAPTFEQHFAPLENLETIDVNLINEAGETIDLAAYVLTDAPVIEALTLAAQRGVKVRIFRQYDPSFASARSARAIAGLLAAGAQERFKQPGSPLMHLKAYCVDNQAFRFGAANFSPTGLKRQDNDLGITRGARVCEKFEADFNRMWR